MIFFFTYHKECCGHDRLSCFPPLKWESLQIRWIQVWWLQLCQLVLLLLLLACVSLEQKTTNDITYYRKFGMLEPWPHRNRSKCSKIGKWVHVFVSGSSDSKKKVIFSLLYYEYVGTYVFVHGTCTKYLENSLSLKLTSHRAWSRFGRVTITSFVILIK